MRIRFTSRFFQAVILALTCAQFVHCRLTEDSATPEIYPTAGSTNIPVNTMIEIQYPKELGVTEKDINSDLFSIQECELNTFSYLDPTKKANVADPTKKDASADSQKKDDKGNPIPDPNDGIGGDSSKKIGTPLHVFPRTVVDGGRIFNYLVIDPDSNNSPLKAKTTYCVTARKIKTASGLVIGQKEISFTTEDAVGFQFQTKFDATFFGDTLAPSKLGADGKFAQQDYMLLYLDGHPVRPADVKSHLRLCLATPDQTVFSSETCHGHNGKIIDSDVRMIVPLQSDQDQHIPARYNLYAISAHGEMNVGDKYWVILDLDMGKGQDTEIGETDHEFNIDNQDFYGWRKAYSEQIKDSAGNSIVAKNQLIFYLGPGANSAGSSSNTSNTNSPTTSPKTPDTTNPTTSSADAGSVQATP